MADNITLNSGSGGATCAADDVSSVHYQYVKLADGTSASSTVIAAGGGVEAGALRVTIASDSTGVLSIDDNGSSITIDGSLTNISGTISLPTGAATAAKQPALGTAGTASADVITIQGIASMTPVLVTLSGTNNITNAGTFAVQVDGALLTSSQLIDDMIYAEDAGHSSGDKGAFVLGVRRDSFVGGVTSADGDYSALAVNEFGVQFVTTVGSGAGAVGTQTPRVTLASDDPAVVALQVLDNAISGSEMQVDIVSSALPTNAAAETGGNLAAAATSLAVLDDWDESDKAKVTLKPGTSGGLTISRTISAASTNGTNVKSSGGQLYWAFVSNINAAVRYLKFYNKATTPTVGTDTPVLTLAIPGNAAGAGFTIGPECGLAFGTGIGFGITTGVADNDTGAVAANELVVNLGYA